MVDYIEGEILVFDKPLHWTSFDVVNRVRGMLCRKLGVKKLKVGHAGTLDPLATGVVIVCTGKKTKQIDQLMEHIKEYEAVLQLGATTPSYDLEHPVDATYPTEHITRELIEKVLPTFLGEQWQVPPVYSAVKINGKRAYEYARKGQQDSIDIKPKLLAIDAIDLKDFDPKTMQLSIRVVCSKGTYIRALARDIGERLNSGAHLIALRRTRVGDYTIDDCLTVEQFKQQLDAENPIIETDSNT